MHLSMLCPTTPCMGSLVPRPLISALCCVSHLWLSHAGSVRSLQESCMLLIKNNWTIYEKQAVCLPPRLRSELDNYNTNTDLMHAHHVYPLDSDFVWCVPDWYTITTEESEELHAINKYCNCTLPYTVKRDRVCWKKAICYWIHWEEPGLLRIIRCGAVLRH